MDRGAGRATVPGVAKSQTRVSLHVCVQETKTHLNNYLYIYLWGSWVAQMVKNLPALQEARIQSLNQESERSPGERNASHSSILAWRIPWTDHEFANSWIRLSD